MASPPARDLAWFWALGIWYLLAGSVLAAGAAGLALAWQPSWAAAADTALGAAGCMLAGQAGYRWRRSPLRLLRRELVTLAAQRITVSDAWISSDRQALSLAVRGRPWFRSWAVFRISEETRRKMARQGQTLAGWEVFLCLPARLPVLRGQGAVLALRRDGDLDVRPLAPVSWPLRMRVRARAGSSAAAAGDVAALIAQLEDAAPVPR